MSKFTVIVILFIAITVLYCSNRHQRLLTKPISKHWRTLALMLFITAIIIAFSTLSKLAASFFIILILMLALMVMPFASLIKVKGLRNDT